MQVPASIVAAGLFQYEPGTWIGQGGGAYAPVAQDATWQQQVAVFVKGTAGNNFGAWGPDLVANSGDPNSSSNPAYGYTGAPQAGSRVANEIANLTGAGAFTGLGTAADVQAVAAWASANPSTADTSSSGSSSSTSSSSGGGGSWVDSLPIVGPLFAGASDAVAADRAVADVLAHLLEPTWWERIGMGALGIAVFGIGLVGFISTTKPGQQARSDIGGAVKDAAVVAAAA